MSHITVAMPPLNSLEELDELIKEMPQRPDGCQARYVGRCDGELRIVSVWDSAEDAERWRNEHVLPTYAKFYPDRDPGRIEQITVASEYLREPVG